jgi:predicted nucleotidyltransferase
MSDSVTSERGLPARFMEILRVEVGSTAHGVNVSDQDDKDQMGVCVEPPDYICGLKPFQQHQYRTAWTRTLTGKGTQPQPRSQSGDLDLMIYSLRKWCSMALGGNPSVQLLLYSPKVIIDTPWGRSLRDEYSRKRFASKAVIYAFLNYMREQRLRLEGKIGQKGVKRPELIEQYGFDTKYAYHVLRLGIQGYEFATYGRLTLPMEPVHQEFLIAVRTGHVTFEDVLAHAALRERDLEKSLGTSTLPDEPDREGVDRWLMRCYQKTWQAEGVDGLH